MFKEGLVPEPMAQRQGVSKALAQASGALCAEDNLFVTFKGSPRREGEGHLGRGAQLGKVGGDGPHHRQTRNAVAEAQGQGEAHRWVGRQAGLHRSGQRRGERAVMKDRGQEQLLRRGAGPDDEIHGANGRIGAGAQLASNLLHPKEQGAGEGEGQEHEPRGAAPSQEACRGQAEQGTHGVAPWSVSKVTVRSK